MYDWYLDLLDNHQLLVLWSTALLGLSFGALAQWSRFCLLRGLVEACQQQSYQKLRLFVLALAFALLGSQFLVWQGIVDLQASIYVQSTPPLLALLLGGVLFGYGMALANACGARSLVLLASGNLRSVVTLFALALAAGMTLSGLLAPVRIYLEDLTRVELPFAQLPAWMTLPLVAVALAWVLKSDQFRRSPKQLLAGALIGLLVPAGWWITGYLGADDFEPVRLASMTFVAPVTETQQYLQLSTGTRLSFGVVLVAGVLAGALLRALLGREFAWQGFESISQLQGSLVGGLLMGFGGVLALGCSLGQGLTGVSTLALASMVALVGILFGAWLKIRLAARA
ncbi:hypothetical protein SAMN05660443_1000 [Marinospirillum celere]|uniref:Uncharacterized protein n=1 Tax=Marinospirillum celere TaxID=1122252 RepID=A0A1I1FN33_9GAMM|nr:YeeE/YedE family protein [Marinospirillum celere]SFB98513.1 hypothetical protein SAMN05660443_1000 [Marinospirillum celere]